MKTVQQQCDSMQDNVAVVMSSAQLRKVSRHIIFILVLILGIFFVILLSARPELFMRMFILDDVVLSMYTKT